MNSPKLLRSAVQLMIGLTLLTSRTAFGQANSWTNPASGNWEDPQWSLGSLPAEFDSIQITNENSKTVSITASTVQNFAASLTNNTLQVSAPAGFTNTLFLNSYGTNVYYFVYNNPTIDTNGHLSILDSGVVFYRNSFINGTITQIGGDLQSGSSGYELALNGAYNFTNGRAHFYTGTIGKSAQGTFSHAGGSISAVVLELGFTETANGSYLFLNGDLSISFAAFIGRRGIGSFTQRNGNMSVAGNINLGLSNTAFGSYLLESGFLTATNINVADKGSATFTQNGGTNLVTSSLYLHPNDSSKDAEYILNDGLLQTGNTSVSSGNAAKNEFVQNGGVHRTAGLSVTGNNFAKSKYKLVNGLLSASGASISGGAASSPFSQSGGIADFTGGIGISGFGDSMGRVTVCSFSGGSFRCSDLSSDSADIGISGTAAVVISNRLSITGAAVGFLQPPYLGASTFSVTGGSLLTSNIEVNARMSIAGPTPHLISNLGYFRLSRFLTISRITETLGRLQVVAGPIPTPSIYFTGESNKLAFEDSSAEAWNTPLYLNGWNGSLTGGGAHQLFIGTNASGVTASQLSQIKFVNVPGLSGTNSARILSTGEIVPFYQSTLYLQISQGSLILNWSNAVSLQTSTNVEGPYVDVSATSPYTNNFTEAQRFFRLRQ